MAETNTELISRSIFQRNPIALLVLGICSALAVTGQMTTAFVMSICVTLVVAFSSMTISIVRFQIPNSVRIGLQIMVIATLVILVDQILKAFFFTLSKQLSIYVGLIITNCIVMGRAEGFAMRNGPVDSMLDGLGNGLGYGFILMIVGAIREFFGRGSLFGFQILIPTSQGGGFEPLHLMLLPPSAFFIIAGIIWIIRHKRPEQVEKPEFKLRVKPGAGGL
jgi:Na+-transporting NADH:ubiquinone oxidoreductase subunit D